MLLQLRPFDSSTPEGRSKERYRRVAFTALASTAARGISIFTSLISVPLTIRYLGVERYGLWMTISSVIAMLGFADLGMGNGLMNAISEANGQDDSKAARTYVSSSFFMLLGIAILILVGSAVIYPFIHWGQVFSVRSELATQEAGLAMAAFVLCFALNMPLGVVQRVQLGYQEGFASNLWQCLGSVFGLFGVLVAIHVKGGLPWLVLAAAGSPVLAALLNGVFLFGREHPQLRPDWKSVTWKAVRKIFRLGMLFYTPNCCCASLCI